MAYSDVLKSIQNLAINGPVKGKFDASLTLGYNGNLDLTLTLKVWLVQLPGTGKRRLTDVDNTEFEADSWPSEEWRTFGDIYQSGGEKFWNNRFWLTHLNDDWDGLDYPFDQSIYHVSPHTFPMANFGHALLRTPNWSAMSEYRPTRGMVRPAINCRFRLQLVSHRDAFHTMVRVAYVTKHGDGRPIGPGEFRSYSKLNTHLDLRERTLRTEDQNGETVMAKQTPYVHEIGHLLGQPHVGVPVGQHPGEATCLAAMLNQAPESANADACYGVNHDTIHNIMGAGMSLSPRNAFPWQAALAQLTNTNPAVWPVSVDRPLTATIVARATTDQWY